VNSGSEANDLAIMMARAYTGNFDVIALRNGYHGMSPSTMGLTGLSTWKQLAPNAPGIHHVRHTWHFPIRSPLTNYWFGVTNDGVLAWVDDESRRLQRIMGRSQLSRFPGTSE